MLPARAGDPPHAIATNAQREIRKGESEASREERRKLTPAEKEAKRKEIKARLDARLAELRSRQTSGILTSNEQRELSRCEQIRKRFDQPKAPRPGRKEEGK